jgi:hypothetical protein
MRTITKLQEAGRTFLLRLVAEHGLAGAARMLRALADEIASLCAMSHRDNRPSRNAKRGQPAGQ